MSKEPRYCHIHGCELEKELTNPIEKYDPYTGKGTKSWETVLWCPYIYKGSNNSRCWVKYFPKQKIPRKHLRFLTQEVGIYVFEDLEPQCN